MKHVVGAVFASWAVAIFTLAPGLASDLPVRRDAPPPIVLPATAPGVLPFNWGGLHIGLNVGGGFGDVSGIVAGGQIGYNWQVGRIVFGVETDLQWSDQDDNAIIAGVAASQELTWFGTLRGRVGYTVFERWLPYVTGGLAYGGREVSGGPFRAEETAIGWAFGVGLDYAINNMWSARLEYLHISLDSFSPTFAGVTINVGRLDNDIIRGALNYKLMPAW
jgi:outer membrane immunogenic protein